MRTTFPSWLACGISVSALLLSSSGQGQCEAAPSETPQMEVAAHPVPPGLFTEGIQPDKLKDFFEKSGLEFPPGSDVTFDQAKSMLYMRNTASDVVLLDLIMGGIDCRFYSLISVDLHIFEIERPSANGPAQSKLSTAEFLSLPKENQVLLDRITAVSQSGIGTLLANTSTNPQAAAKMSAGNAKSQDPGWLPKFSPSEFGTKVFAESIVGPDGQSIETNLSVRFRLPRDRSARDFDFSATFSASEGSPVVVFSAPLGQKGKWLAVVARHTLVDFGGSKIPFSPDPSPPRQE